MLKLPGISKNRTPHLCLSLLALYSGRLRVGRFFVENTADRHHATYDELLLIFYLVEQLLGYAHARSSSPLLELTIFATHASLRSIFTAGTKVRVPKLQLDLVCVEFTWARSRGPS